MEKFVSLAEIKDNVGFIF